MGQDTAAALKQVDDARAALESDLSALLDRLPPGARLAQTAAAGGGGVIALGIAQRQLAKRAAEKKRLKVIEKEAGVQARAIAAAFAAVQQAAQPVAEPVAAAAAAPSTASIADALDTVEDDDGAGGVSKVLLLLISVVAAVAAYLFSQQGNDDDDLWIPPAE